MQDARTGIFLRIGLRRSPSAAIGYFWHVGDKLTYGYIALQKLYLVSLFLQPIKLV